MERNSLSLSIPPNLLASYAQRSFSYAKALHYKELEAFENPSLATMEELININTFLQQKDAAVGILSQARSISDHPLEESWYTKLNRWDDALELLDRKAMEAPESTDVMLTRMRCMHALGAWGDVLQLAEETWGNADEGLRANMSYFATNAAWGLHKWGLMRTFAKALKKNDPQRPWMRAVLSINKSEFDEAQGYINEARDQFSSYISKKLAENYSRAYR